VRILSGGATGFGCVAERLDMQNIFGGKARVTCRAGTNLRISFGEQSLKLVNGAKETGNELLFKRTLFFMLRYSLCDPRSCSFSPEIERIGELND